MVSTEDSEHPVTVSFTGSLAQINKSSFKSHSLLQTPYSGSTSPNELPLLTQFIHSATNHHQKSAMPSFLSVVETKTVSKKDPTPANKKP